MFRNEDYNSRAVNLMPNSINPISVFVQFDKPSSLLTPTLVNAVDANSGELIYSWLLIIETVA